MGRTLSLSYSCALLRYQAAFDPTLPVSDSLDRPKVIILMGVSGAGKTTIGTQLAEALGWEFFDGDDFHPADNVDKMAQGIPLTDDDRWPWLRALHDFIHERLLVGAPAVVACSALKADYRRILVDGNEGARIVYLKGSRSLIRRRLEQRPGHFFDPELLDSQFDTLEEPDPDEVLTVDIDRPPEAIIRTIIEALALDAD